MITRESRTTTTDSKPDSKEKLGKPPEKNIATAVAPSEQKCPVVQISDLLQGQVVEGTIKRIEDYGAFVDLDGFEALLLIPEISWYRFSHPTAVLAVGQCIRAVILFINYETQRISLSTKQLEINPWPGMSQKYPSGSSVLGRVTKILDYGVWVDLEPGIDGLIHVSELSSGGADIHPSDIVTISQEVNVEILEIDPVKRRIALRLKI